MNEKGQCVVAKEVPMGEDVDKDGTPKKGNYAQSAYDTAVSEGMYTCSV